MIGRCVCTIMSFNACSNLAVIETRAHPRPPSPTNFRPSTRISKVNSHSRCLPNEELPHLLQHVIPLLSSCPHPLPPAHPPRPSHRELPVFQPTIIPSPPSRSDSSRTAENLVVTPNRSLCCTLRGDATRYLHPRLPPAAPAPRPARCLAKKRRTNHRDLRRPPPLRLQ